MTMKNSKSKFVVQKAVNKTPQRIHEIERKLGILSTIYSETERNIKIFGNQIIAQKIQELNSVPTAESITPIVDEVKRLLLELQVYQNKLKNVEKEIQDSKTTFSTGKRSITPQNGIKPNDLYMLVHELKAVQFLPACNGSTSQTLGHLEEYSVNSLCKQQEALLDGKTRSSTIESYRSLSNSEDTDSIDMRFIEQQKYNEQQKYVLCIRGDSTNDTPQSSTDHDSDHGSGHSEYGSSHSGEDSEWSDDEEDEEELGIQQVDLLWHKVHECLPSSSKLGIPDGVAFLPDDNIVVADNAQRRLVVYDRDGSVVRTIHQDKLTRVLGDWHFEPQCVVSVPNSPHAHVLLSDSQDKCLKVFSAETGRYVRSINTHLHYSPPYGVAFLSDGLVAVTHCNDLISMHDLEGNTVKVIKDQGNFWYVSTDSFHRIIVTDIYNSCVKVFDDKGTFLFAFGEKGQGEGQLYYPHGVCVTENGSFLVADSMNNRVCLFSHTGKFIQNVLVASDGIQWPRSLAINDDGLLAVTWGNCVSLWRLHPGTSRRQFTDTHL